MPLVINSLGHGHTRTRTHILTIRTGSILKTHGKTRLVQYIITAKNPFKTSIDALQVMLLNFKKCIPQTNRRFILFLPQYCYSNYLWLKVNINLTQKDTLH